MIISTIFMESLCTTRHMSLCQQLNWSRSRFDKATNGHIQSWMPGRLTNGYIKLWMLRGGAMDHGRRPRARCHAVAGDRRPAAPASSATGHMPCVSEFSHGPHAQPLPVKNDRLIILFFFSSIFFRASARSCEYVTPSHEHAAKD
jgi:hypothetical protein